MLSLAGRHLGLVLSVGLGRLVSFCLGCHAGKAGASGPPAPPLGCALTCGTAKLAHGKDRMLPSSRIALLLVPVLK